MDASEFEFPPDQLDYDVAASLPAFPTSIPDASHTPCVYPTQSLPLSVLAQMSVDQLPPTQPHNPQNFSIGQVMRGALSTAHMRSTSGSSSNGGGCAGLPRPTMNVVAPLPRMSYAPGNNSPRHWSYLSAGNPPPPSISSDEEERGGGGVAEESFAQQDNNGDGGRELNSSGHDSAIPVPQSSGRQARIDWSEGEVRNFYQALSQYGTDFGAIAVLFPRRSRSDIKRLYQREMRLKPKEVQQALNHKDPIDMKVFQERYEAKKKEVQVPIKTKQLNVEELALVDEIENGLMAGASTTENSGEGEVVPPLANPKTEEATTAAATFIKSRKRKREAVVAESTKKDTETARKVKEVRRKQRDIENETLFDIAMRHDREDNTPLESLFGGHTTTSDDADFAFD